MKKYLRAFLTACPRVQMPLLLLVQSCVRIAQWSSRRWFVYVDLSAFGACVVWSYRLTSSITEEQILQMALTRKVVFVSSAIKGDMTLYSHLQEFYSRVSWAYLDSFHESGRTTAALKLLRLLLSIRNFLILLTQADLRSVLPLNREEQNLYQILHNSTRQLRRDTTFFKRASSPHIRKLLGIAPSEKYICFVLRSSSTKFKDEYMGQRRVAEVDSNQDFRNSDPKTYSAALRFYIASGIRVLLMGSEGWSVEDFGLPDCEGIIDVSKRLSDWKNKQFDIYSDCLGAFHGGLNGAADIAWMLRKPLAIANCVPLDGLVDIEKTNLKTKAPMLLRNGDVSWPNSLPLTLVLPKAFRKVSTGVFLTLENMARCKLYSDLLIADCDLETVDNSSLQILDLAKDFLSFTQNYNILKGDASVERLHESSIHVGHEWVNALVAGLSAERRGQAGVRAILDISTEHIPENISVLHHALVAPSYLRRINPV